MCISSFKFLHPYIILQLYGQGISLSLCQSTGCLILICKPRVQCNNEMKCLICASSTYSPKWREFGYFTMSVFCKDLVEECCRHGKFPFAIVTAHPYGAPSSCCNLKPRHASSARLGKYRDSSVPIVFTLPAVLF